MLNEVRKPVSKTHREVVALFKQNYSGIQIAKTQLSNLLGFKRILASPLTGKAFEQTKNLVKEFNL